MFTKGDKGIVTGTSYPIEGALVRVLDARHDELIIELVGYEGNPFALDRVNVAPLDK